MKALFVLFAAMLFMGSVAVSVKTSPAFKFADSGAALALGGQDLPRETAGAAQSGIVSQPAAALASSFGSAQVLGANAQAVNNLNQSVPKVSPQADPIRGLDFSRLAAATGSRASAPQVLGDFTNNLAEGGGGAGSAAAFDPLDYKAVLDKQDGEVKQAISETEAALKNQNQNKAKSDNFKKSLTGSLEEINQASAPFEESTLNDSCAGQPINLTDDPNQQQLIINNCSNLNSRLQNLVDQKTNAIKQKNSRVQSFLSGQKSLLQGIFEFSASR